MRYAMYLQNFQKVAIYRRMMQYRREHERGQIQIAQLERSKIACEAELAAVDASWNQVCLPTLLPFLKP